MRPPEPPTTTATSTRRAFLTAAGGLVLAAACGSGAGKHATRPGVRSNGLNALTLSIEPYVSRVPERFAFVVADDRGRWIAGPPATIAVKAPNGVAGPPTPTALHSQGLPSGRGAYALDTPFAAAGVWSGVVRVAGHPDAALSWEVTATPQVPTPGSPAPRTPSPTTADTLGVDPLCTRQPACPLHRVSLDRALANGKPVALMFATPARCQTRYCGPALDQLLAVQDTYRDRVQLLHVEIYKDATSDALVPTVDEWRLPGEPWLFGIDRSGRIVGRLDGAMGTDEVKALLDRIA